MATEAFTFEVLASMACVRTIKGPGTPNEGHREGPGASEKKRKRPWTPCPAHARGDLLSRLGLRDLGQGDLVSRFLLGIIRVRVWFLRFINLLPGSP